ncbi:MAG: signal peptidase I [Candidatus Woesearchaeota archaeon]|nr:MAG: signal peptidase I [Candidatus Woesearchaeota archaeon]
MTSALRKIWYFIWKDDSIWSWIVNIILAFLIVYFIIYPGLGLLFDTKLPVVAVVSGSMEHSRIPFDDWWDKNSDFYIKNNFTKQQFENLKFKNGFNKGDIMLLFGTAPEKIKIGDVIVFNGNYRDPVIHRVVKINKVNNEYLFTTKGDNVDRIQSFEEKIQEKDLLGRAVLRIPYLGWVKIVFTSLWR